MTRFRDLASADPSPRQAVAELIFAAALWGLGFIATRWALTGMGPLWITSLRFWFTLMISLPLVWMHFRRAPEVSRRLFRLAILPGFYLSLAAILQTKGLQYTTVAKSAFITCLYVVSVPLLEWRMLGARLHRWHFLLVAVSLVGMALISKTGWDGWNRGDFLTLAASLAAAFHILEVERIVRELDAPVVFNAYQAFWCALLPTVVALFKEPFPSHLSFESQMGLIVLTVICTFLAFIFQIRSQRVLPVALVTMLYLLEAPIAALYAFAFFGEWLTLSQWLGGGLILFAAVVTSRLHRGKPLSLDELHPRQAQRKI